MKKTLLLFLLVPIVVCCSKDKQDNQGGILIKGKIPATGTKKSSMTAFTETPALADAKAVLVLFGDQYNISEINNGSFALRTPMGSATVLIFVDSENRYIGNLSASDLNMLPLVSLSEGEETVIDLSTLSQEGTSIIPANNPIGSEIMISMDDVTLLKELGSYYESLAKNIDTDNDGIPDYYTGKQILVTTSFMMNIGSWGINNTVPVVYETAGLPINYSVRIKGWKNLIPQVMNISLTGPEGNPYDDIVKTGYYYNESCGCFDVAFSRQVSSPESGSFQPPFTKGVYTFSMDGIHQHTLSFYHIDAQYFLVLAIPTLKTNNEGKVTGVQLEYRLPDNSLVDPGKIVSTLMLQFQGAGGQLHQEGAIFDLINPLPDFTNILLSKTLNTADIKGLNVSYTDLPGNIYNLFWIPPQ